LRGGCDAHDLFLERLAPAHGDAVPIAREGHAQRRFHPGARGAPGDVQLVAVVANGRLADAIDDRAFLGNAVLQRCALIGAAVHTVG
jgi:hypothetical protein